MDIKKIIIYLALALLGVTIWTAWQKDYPPTQVKQSQNAQNQQKKATPDTFTPSTYQSGSVTQSPPPKTERKISVVHNGNGATVTLRNDVLKLKIGKAGGNLISAKLLKYSVSLKEKNILVTLLNHNPENLFLAQSGVTNRTRQGKITFQSSKNSNALQPGQQQISVRLTGRSAKGLLITKTYTLKRNQYAIDTHINVKNVSSRLWKGSIFYQFTRKDDSKHKYFSRSYTGAAISSPDVPYEKLSYKSLSEENVDRNVSNGWIAMQQPYFLGAWVPPRKLEKHYYSRSFGQGKKGKGNTFILGYVSPQVSIAPGHSVSSQSILYVGPEIAKRLNAVADGLDRTIDYGWLWFLSKPVFWVMAKIHSLIGNWGWSIVLVTLLIKLLFYPLSNKSFKSMAKMRNVAPRLQALKERHAGDKQALGKATMEFYKREKVNPMGGCLPMIIQIPVFIALYYVLIESVQLRQAPFIFWIHDLSVKDPYYVLPVLMGISMFVQQKISPPPPDPTQAKMMMLLPVVFTVFFLSFPAGLVLYWLTNNCLTIAQQWYVLKTYDPKKEKKKKKKKKR